jgi:prepilin-type N-terminal cleavage/methylation domain-containing protein
VRHEATKGKADCVSLRASVPSRLRASPRRGFTLLEMLTTVAVLIILFGLMIDLANRVRNRSATDLARQVLGDLDAAMQQYHDRFSDYPPVHPFTSSPDLAEDEDTLLRSARQNNRDFVARLDEANLLDRGKLTGFSPDGAILHDAWDTPIVFIRESHGKIGMAPQGRGFFFSAGPDRLYKTREDNVYSYEVRRPTD